jgi:GNAT superfamily N-acetyltransferase
VTDGLLLRPAVRGDVPTILELIRGLAGFERLAHECVATEEQLRDTLFGPNPGAEVILAVVNGEPAGFALFFHNYSTFLARRGLYLEDLFVKPQFRDRGIGHALLTELAKIAVKRGCGRLEWAVLDWNVDAIRFYESIGARQMNDWRTFRVTGPALMELAGDK